MINKAARSSEDNISIDIVNNTSRLMELQKLTIKELYPALVRSSSFSGVNIKTGQTTYISWCATRSDYKQSSPTPLCLAICTIFYDQSDQLMLNLDSIFTPRLHRGLGICSKVLARIVQWCQANNFSKIVIDLPSSIDKEIVSIYDLLFSEKKGWLTAGHKELIHITERSKVSNLSLRIERLIERVEQAEIHFIYLTDLDSVCHYDFSFAFEAPSWAIPEGSETIVDFVRSHFNSTNEYSIFLVKNQQILGWIITDLISPAVLRYTIAWTHRRLKSPGALIYALGIIIKAAHLRKANNEAKSSNIGHPIEAGCFCFFSDNNEMRQFAHRVLAPISSKTTKTTTKVFPLQST